MGCWRASSSRRRRSDAGVSASRAVSARHQRRGRGAAAELEPQGGRRPGDLDAAPPRAAARFFSVCSSSSLSGEDQHDPARLPGLRPRRGRGRRPGPAGPAGAGAAGARRPRPRWPGWPPRARAGPAAAARRRGRGRGRWPGAAAGRPGRGGWPARTGTGAVRRAPAGRRASAADARRAPARAAARRVPAGARPVLQPALQLLEPLAAGRPAAAAARRSRGRPAPSRGSAGGSATCPPPRPPAPSGRTACRPGPRGVLAASAARPRRSRRRVASTRSPGSLDQGRPSRRRG